MDSPPRNSLRTSLPITPKRRGGAYEDLLSMFGSQSSSTSATRARRQSSITQRSEEAADKPNAKRPVLPSTLSACTSIPKPNIDTSTKDMSKQSSQTRSDASSEDELAKPIRETRTTRLQQHLEELKMEKRNKEREPRSLRRSTRKQKDEILTSDTTIHLQPKAPNPRARRIPKLNTARARLRDDIAQKTKAKAHNFLVANKDYFLPLLPENNNMSRLVSKAKHAPIVEYEPIQQQPAGVTATMKSYQLEGLSFLVHLHQNGFSGILGDEMGLGKTLQTLSLFQYLEEQDSKAGIASEELRPYLVVCPLSVLNSWVMEAQRMIPELKVLRFHGTANERDRLKRVAMGLEDQRGNETKQAKKRKASKKAGLKVSKIPAEEHTNSYKIVVTTYDTFQAEQSWFKHSFVWRYVVLDEGHKIKSSVTQVSNALKSIASEYRLILTGTPLQNNLLEMWALLAWLYPDVFTENTQTLFKESFDLSHGKINRKTMDDARHLLELIMLRRMKDSPNVNLGLPPKTEILLYVPLTPMQRFWYTRLLTRVDNTMLNDLFADGKNKEKTALEKEKEEDQLLACIEKQLEVGDVGKTAEKWEETTEIMRQAYEREQQAKGDSNGDNKGAWRKLMNLVMQLRKCCSHPYLLPGAFPEPYQVGSHVIRASGKFILLEKLLRNSIFVQGKKVLIFSGFTKTLDFCEDLLAMMGNFGQSFKYLRLDGGTARARRNLDIRLFNDLKSDYKVMLLSTRAGGLGINLTTAEDVIFLDEDWNPQITLQAEARAHRIGQTKPVTIYKLCTQGTVEEQMMGRIRKKLYLSAKITESMKSVHGHARTSSTKGRPSLDDAVPEMSTNQLKSLVRRGAQTLSHPEIDVTDMLSWDLETMMEKCRAVDPQANPAAQTEVDEEKWLSAMERVECAVFDGKRFERNRKEKATDHILPDSITREDRRKGKNTTVLIGGFYVNKESLHCAEWEAVPTFAGKDPRLAEPESKRERREFEHEDHCLVCFDSAEDKHSISCRSCPRTYHFDCLEPEYQAKVKALAGFFCPQHVCCDCGKNTTDAGGLIYRCRWCPRGFCEDCLSTTEELVGDNLQEFDMLGEGPTATGFYIKCSECIESNAEDEEGKTWMETMERSYAEQHAEWVKTKEKEQREIETMQETDQKKAIDRSRSWIIDDDDSGTGASPPALTDVSFPTTATGDSGFNTPRLPQQGPHQINSNKRTAPKNEEQGDFRTIKKAKLEQLLSVDTDSLYGNGSYDNTDS